MRSFFKGLGVHLPSNVIDNHHLSKIMETSDEWIQKRTGIVTRHYADLDQASSDLAVRAAEAAVADARLERSEIDFIIFATMTPDFYFPGSGPVFQRKFGLVGTPCLDIRQQCSGFLYGMDLADALVKSGKRRNVLLVGSEVHGCFMPWKSWDVVMGESPGPVSAEEYVWNTKFRDRTILFGDAAGAAVISAAPEESGGILDIEVFADGDLSRKMCVNSGGSAYRPYFQPAMYEAGDTVPVVEGREVFKTAVTRMPEAVEGILKKNGLGLADLDLLIMHQANLRINEAVQKRLDLPDEKVFNNIQKYGNTTAATLPLAFYEARLAGMAPPGSLVCFVALGSGLTWGAALYRC